MPHDRLGKMRCSYQTSHWLFLILLGEIFICNRQALGAVGGWFARSADVLRQVGDVLLDPASQHDQPLKRWLTAADAFEQCDKATGQAIYEARHITQSDTSLQMVLHILETHTFS